MPPSEGSTGTSQSLERGLAILSSFNSDRPLIGVSELSRDLDLSRSTAHRYIATLAQLGYLQQDPDSKRYRLGPKVLDLGFSAINSMDLREISAPHLRQLSDETRVHGQPRDPRRHRRRLHRALPHGSARASGRSTSTSTSARGSRPTAPRWARRSSPSCPRTASRRSSSRSTSPPAGRTRSPIPEAFREELGADPRVGHRGERRGARLRAALDRRADPLALGRGRRRAQPRRPPHDGVDGRADRALRPRRHRRRRTTSRSSMGHRLAPA